MCEGVCVFLRSLCQCVCSSNTGFSPYYPHLPPSFLSSLLMVTHQPPVNLKPNLIYPSCHYFKTLHISLHVTYLFHTDFLLPSTRPSIHFPTHRFIAFDFPSSTLLYFPFTSHLCFLALPFLSLPHTVHSVLLPSSLSLSPTLSLSFTQCSVPRSLWLGCSSVAESLCALRCLQSIPSTRAHNQVLPLSSYFCCFSSPSPSFLSIPVPPLLFAHSTWLHIPPCGGYIHPFTVPFSDLTLSFPPCLKHIALGLFSGVPSNSLLETRGSKGCEGLDACMLAWPNLSVFIFIFLAVHDHPNQ